MEEKKNAIWTEERKSLHLTGVSEVLVFQETAAEFTTNLGKLQITGENLHMEKLDLESGQVHLTGKIISLYYPEDSFEPKKRFLSRIFS